MTTCDPCVSNFELDASDVYKVQGTTSTIIGTPTTAVTVALSEADMQTAYDNSCAPATKTFDDFKAAIQIGADNEATAQYDTLAAINNVNPTVFRIVWARICIDIGWVQIYINWHI